MFNIIFCQWLDSNRGPLELEATALPSEPPPIAAAVQNKLLWISENVVGEEKKPCKAVD